MGTSALALISIISNIWLAVRLHEEKALLTARELVWNQERHTAQSQLDQLKAELRKSSPPETDTQPRGSHQGTTGRNGAPPAELAFAIAPGIFRDRVEKVLEVPPGTKTLRLTFETDTILRRGMYRTAIRTEEGAGVWRGTGQIDATPSARPGVTITVPAEILSPGRYLVAVSEDRSNEVINDYVFRVTR